MDYSGAIYVLKDIKKELFKPNAIGAIALDLGIEALQKQVQDSEKDCFNYKCTKHEFIPDWALDYLCNIEYTDERVLDYVSIKGHKLKDVISLVELYEQKEIPIESVAKAYEEGKIKGCDIIEKELQKKLSKFIKRASKK